MQDIPIWKWLLIVVVLGLCGWCLYPPSQRLKPGLDLAGGSTLVYQVEVPPQADAKRVIDQVIETLKKRVDPNGVKNLIWRRQEGNRIEIQVPLPPAQTSRRHADYQRLYDQLMADNLSERSLDSALRVDASQRQATLQRLAGSDAHRLKLLEQVAVAHDAVTAARAPYQELQQRLKGLEAELDGLAAEPSSDERSALQAQIQSAQDELISRTRSYLDVRKVYLTARQRVLETNVDPHQLERILSLPLDAPRRAKRTDNGDLAPATRDAALEALIRKHQDRAGQIRDLAKAKAMYDEVRGQLDDPNDLITLLRGSGVLEFRIAAPPDLADVQAYRQQLDERGPKGGRGKSYRWFVIDDPASFVDNQRDRRALEEDPVAYFEGRGLIGQAHGSDYYILLANTPDKSITRSHKDWKLAQATMQVDENGFRAVGFKLNRLGGQFMGNLTGSHLGQPMAIVLDGRAISTPRINDRIHDQGVISGGRGGFSQQEQSYLLRTLNAGSLQGQLSEDPIYIKKFGPQLGQDNLRHGMQAAIWALIAVAVFMALYYLFLGVVADFALVANMVIILAAMALTKATFTLPGIAGIVLTIGMAVDANVLIFERIREELGQRTDLRAAVRLGYDKALSTIIDANLTTLITCVILYYRATAEIKGFAVTLMIGILATMFTALFCTRVIVDTYLNLAKPKTVVMMPTIIGGLRRWLCPNVDWVGKRYVFMGASVVLVVVGLSIVFQRGQDLLDIEFRSGTQVGFELAGSKRLDLVEVRTRLTQAADRFDLPDLAGNRASVVTVGQVWGAQASEFSVATLETNAPAVSEAIKTVFADVLDTQRAIHFMGVGQGHEAPALGTAPVYAIRHVTLGQNINRPELDVDVTDFLGGVVAFLDQMSPPPSIDELTDRIERMRMQPAYEGLGFRSYKVMGLDLDPAASGDGSRYRSAVVLASEEGTNYIDDPSTFDDPEGLAATHWRLVRDATQRDTSLANVAHFSSQISNVIKLQAISALALSLLAVVGYIWLRFGSLRYGLAAIVALVHDVAITLGLVAVAGLVHNSDWDLWRSLGQAFLLGDFRINLALVAAMLTIVGYSLNDTIVVFDRIRENRGRLALSRAIVNDSISQTISRTVMTSLTTLLAMSTLYVFGGDGVHGFAFAMLVGVLVGTYSSIAIAAPLLLVGVSSSTAANKTANPAKVVKVA